MLAGKARKALHCLLLPAVFFSILIFCQSVMADQAEVDHVNREIWNKGAHWWASETSVSALPRELRKQRLGLVKPAQLSASAQSLAPLETSSPLLGAPVGFNWADAGDVTSVKDQGNCGGCWAFATTAALESQVAMATGSLLDLSEQVLISCGGAGDCNLGGYIDRASNFFVSTGIPFEECYPYIALNGNCSNACPYWQNDTYGLVGWHWVALNNATATSLKNALYTYGPLAVSMEVYSDFYAYGGGVYEKTFSATDEGSHAVELVGYDDQRQCFIVKNSWGTDWGEAGFFNIAYSQVAGVVRFGQYAIAYDGFKKIGAACSYGLSPSYATIGPSGGALTVNVIAQSGCSWTAASNSSWIRVTSGASGSGNGTVTLSVQPLTTQTRTGAVTIAGMLYTLTQIVPAETRNQGLLESQFLLWGDP